MYIRYITINNYPFDRHIISGLKELGHTVDETVIDEIGIKKYKILLKTFLYSKKNYHLNFIGYPLPHFAIVASIISKFKKERIIFNAVCSQYEANVISRGVKKYSLRSLKFWIMDFLAFNLSWKVLLESNSQIDYIHNLTGTPKKKLIRSWTGVNEEDFFYIKKINKLDKFTVVFRGRFLPESGIETVIRAAKILENTGIYFRVIGQGHMHIEYNRLLDELNPNNFEELTRIVPIEELRVKMQECHVSLGQIAVNERLDRTLPCKLFETIAMKLPYLTGRNQGVLELLDEDENCICVKPGDHVDLAKKLIYLRDNQNILKKIEENGYKMYQTKLRSITLTKEILDNINK